MKEGYFSLVLHAHLPYVCHLEEDRLEERWVFEALTETYIPLIWALESAQVKGAVTISFSPPLMEMLADQRIQERYWKHLENTEKLIKKELEHTEEKEQQRLVEFYQSRFHKIKTYFRKYNRNILNAYCDLKEKKLVTLMTSAATHAFLPYVQSEAGVRSQIREGIRCFEKHFNEKPLGFWLPECAFAPGIDKILVEEGIRYTFVDEHAILSADPKPDKDSRAPIYSPHGLVMFPRHTALSSKVWSSTFGYPGDVDYREFYRDIGYDRDWNYIKPFVHPEGIRVDTGLKFKRVTSHETEEKENYVREWAMNKVQQHSYDYIYSINEEVNKHGDQHYPPYLMVAPFDAELFGHWWFEGPEWIEALLTNGKELISFITPEEFVHRHYYDFTTSHLSFSTWGRDGYGEVWLNEKNAFLYRHYHQMERKLIQALALFSNPHHEQKRAMQQMVREWMLAVSSDWAFILDNQSASQYANERFSVHLQRFNDLQEKLYTGKLTSSYLEEMENQFPFLIEIDEQMFLSKHDQYSQKKIDYEHNPNKGKKKILMLSWEFPPMMVGGLSRHVFDLSKKLVKKGHEVHVITTHIEGYPAYERNQDIHVHRIKSYQPKAENFFDWVGSLNFAMVAAVEKLSRAITFDIIHAHDWLVCVAAKSLKKQLQKPLLVTIHATEHGRNHGIHNSLQFDINQKEWELTYEADRLIVCSRYMYKEVIDIFSLPKEKIAIIPNGVEYESLQRNEINHTHLNQTMTVFSVGRIVKEKGFETIIYAAEKIKHQNLPFTFKIAGKGPMLDYYRQLIKEKNLENYIDFLGFVTDEERNRAFLSCHAVLFPSLYEPFGIVALEGMAAGRPTIVSDTGGFADIIRHRENGLKMIPGHVDSLIDQLQTLYHDPLLRESLVEEALYEVQHQYNWGTIADQTLKEMEQCLSTNLIAKP
ncbi:1,4-alpha-glucan branching protein domain-containing protein [Alkalihalobacillus trypoxylicola]|uniref:Glycosyl transferase n=1 Tax=Alkalihalobacillus trypoxylicola TaxID=519424 RepID=A0A162E936_9BACI|nr:1,4-alpha-glucan branching protein domain-containing protein [Alkalihalobacillus trypoxylicola]KYG32076.1 glycosyl transferase [Alkalihalobacillus trypoxylicola]